MNPRKLAQLLILFDFSKSFGRDATVNPAHVKVFNLVSVGLGILPRQRQDINIVSATPEATLFGNRLDDGVLSVVNVDYWLWLALFFKLLRRLALHL